MKQVIVVRTDLKLSKGKLAAQVSHGSVESMLRSPKELIDEWRHGGAKKVVLKVSSKEDLYKLKQDCKDAGVVCALITDAGHTELPPGTVTVLGIGPDSDDKIDKVAGKLKML
ncbi:MAG: peptidyl-tRNA hydrolase Pth2 [Candidatus Nanoarchaeia archaeon]